MPQPTRKRGKREAEGGHGPPAEKKPYTRPRPGQSVYVPDPTAIVLGGRRSSPLTQACRCWAQALVQPTLDNARDFGPADWAVLARVWEGRESAVEPELSRPQDVLAEGVERAMQLGQGPRLGATDADLAGLAGRVRALDYAHAWAVIWSLQWRADRGVPASGPRGEEWWTLAHRDAHRDPDLGHRPAGA